MFALGVLWGFRSKEELIENGAQELIAVPQEMLPFFRNGRQPV
jgi:phosphoglycolate phosphatase